MTVTGKTVGENIKDAVTLNPEVIRPVENPYSNTGGLAVLKGNIAPDGSVVKRSAVVDEMLVHEGPARVFECEEDAIAAIKGGQIKEGDVVVIRYEGPKGCLLYTSPPDASMVPADTTVMSLRHRRSTPSTQRHTVLPARQSPL